MGWVTKYGSFWGFIPETSGVVHWVAPSATYTVEGRSYPASDSNDGLSPERALLTLNQAVSNATASVGDVIVLLPGAHSWSVSGAISKAGLTITGLPSGKGHLMRQRTSITTSAADEVLNITAANVELSYLHIIGVTAQNAVDYSNAADFLYVHDCSFDLYTAAESTSTSGLISIASAGGASNLLVERCYFESLGGTGPHLDVNDTVTGEVRDSVFRHRGTTALAACVVSATGAVDILFDNCRWIAGTGALMTKAINWAGNTVDSSCQVRRCMFPYGPVPLFASADLDIIVDAESQALLTAAGGSMPINNINAS